MQTGSIGFLISTQTKTPPTKITQQTEVNELISPKSIELGNNPNEVQLVMGKPEKIINLSTQVIHIYKDMKIIYVDGCN